MKNIFSPENKILKNIIILLVVILFGAMSYFALVQKKISIIKNELKDIEKKENSQPNEAVDANQQILEQAKKDTTKTVRAIDGTDHYKGDLSAPIQLIVYDDFECPFCATFAGTIKQIQTEFGDKVVVAIRHYTLRAHPNAIPAAVASECADEQGKFWEMYDKLFANNKDGKLGLDQYKANAKEIGLETDKFNKCLDNYQYKDKIVAQTQEGRESGVSGTPGGFVNGEPIPGAYPFEDFIGSDNRPQEGMKSIIERHLGQ
jgi:protein-disulfide isomerase